MTNRLISLVALTLAVLQVAPVFADGHDDLDNLHWLAGCWQGEGGGGKNQECWMPPEGGMMLGVSRVISAESTMFEFLRIAHHGDGIAYFASPRGKPAVAFPLIESGEGRAVFADPAHDFPQRITYHRDGDGMTARVEAEQNGEWQGFTVTWRRSADGWLDASAAAPAKSSDADLKQQVRDVETAFAKTMADRDHGAFSYFLSDETIFISSATARGRDQVAAKWRKFFKSPAAPFSWQPKTVEVLDSGNLALSTGPVHAPNGELISQFTSIWRQEQPGQWRIIFDKGNQVCPPDDDETPEE